MKIVSNLLFALDIGTRSVVGTIVEKKTTDPLAYEVLDLVSVEHKERAMIDGQIHNVLSVAKVIQEIKRQFEERYGTLHKVQVAAAGRALKTVRGKADLTIDQQTILSTEAVQHLELAAVQNAQDQLLADHKRNATPYYCVGYSILHHFLDGEPIGSLIDQSGQQASVEVIATFLPKVVIESLISSLERADLQMDGLTLEPIAAIHVLIPPSMRRLNVALVDIGAGTSDIAITKENTIIAYGMVPVAGDEITEAISNHYLLDFPVAEQVKRQLNDSETITFSDILGFEQTIERNDILEVLEPTIEHLAESIAQEILKLNNEDAPQAVMLIGGGSMTPTLDLRISKKLDLPIQRVAIRGPNALPMISFREDVPTSPDFVTPVGIAVAATQQPIQYVSAIVNDQSVRLFDFIDVTVGDALIAANIPLSDLFGSPGMGIGITVNGQFVTVPGTFGKPSTIYKNGQRVSADDPLESGDILQVVGGEKGEEAIATVQDVCEIEPLPLTIEGETIFVQPTIFVNGAQAHLQTPLQDRDVIDFEMVQTIEDIFTTFHYHHLLEARTMTVEVNGQRKEIPLERPQLIINDKAGFLQQPVQPNDNIRIQNPTHLSVQSIFERLDLTKERRIHVTFKQQNVTLEKEQYQCYVNQQLISNWDELVRIGDRVVIQSKDDASFIFNDVFAVVDFQLPLGQDVRYQLTKNGLPAQFMDPITNGDQLDLTFIPITPENMTKDDPSM